MKREILRTTAALAALFAFLGCAGGKETEKAKASASAKPAVAVDTVQATTGDVTEGVEGVGTLSPKRRAEIKSEYGGVVEQVFVNDWERVRKGDPLLKVDTREGEVILQKANAALEMAKAAQLEAEAAGSRAEREYHRAVSLFESGLMTRQGMDEAATQREAAAARIGAAKAQVTAAREDVSHASTRLSKATVRAPFDGTVSERMVNPGDLVGEMQKVIFVLVDNRTLDLTLNVPSNRLAALRVGQPVVFTTDAFPGKEFRGKVAHINPSVNPADRSVPVVAQVHNVPEVLKGGMFVKGKIVTGSRKGVVRVPGSALLSQDVAARKADLFLLDNGVARRRTVSIGGSQGGDVEIVAGVAAGETVITRGAFQLKDGDAVRVAGAAGK